MSPKPVVSKGYGSQDGMLLVHWLLSLPDAITGYYRGMPNRYRADPSARFKLTERVCKTCGKPFMGYGTKIYCSAGCRKSSNNRQRFDAYVPTGSIGALGELLVAADLLRKGFEVFRSVSPSCSADIMIHRDGFSRRVEVRTGCIENSGKILANRVHRADILAIVLPDKVLYEPEL